MSVKIVTIPIMYDDDHDAWQRDCVKELDDLMEDGYEIISESMNWFDEALFANFILRKWGLQGPIDERCKRLQLDGPVGSESLEESQQKLRDEIPF